jgi:hypothetical protein
MAAESVMKLVADALADALNEESFAPAIEAERVYRARLTREAVETASVQVAPIDQVTSGIARVLDSIIVTLGVTVIGASGAESGEDVPVERCDEIADAAQQIEDFIGDIENKLIVAAETENWTATPEGDIRSRVVEEWHDDGVFAVEITASYRVMR